MKNIQKWPTTHKVQFWWSWFVSLTLLVLPYQWFHGVFSLWQIFVAIIPCGFIYFNIKSVKSGKVIIADEKLNNVSFENEETDKSNEAFKCMSCSFPIKADKKYNKCQIVSLIICVVLLAFWGVMSLMYNNLDVVEGTIVKANSYGGTTITSNTVSTDEMSFYTIEYMFNDKLITIELKDRFSQYAQGSVVHLCVDDVGDFVCLQDNIYAFRLMFLASLVSMILIIVGWILKLPLKYLIMVAIGFIGIGLIVLFASSNWSSILLHPVSGIGLIFVMPSIMIIGCLITIKIIYLNRKKKDPDYVLE